MAYCWSCEKETTMRFSYGGKGRPNKFFTQCCDTELEFEDLTPGDYGDMSDAAQNNQDELGDYLHDQAIYRKAGL